MLALYLFEGLSVLAHSLRCEQASPAFGTVGAMSPDRSTEPPNIRLLEYQACPVF